MRRRRALEIIAGRVNADGTIAAGDGFTVSKSGTGTYNFTFLGGFRLVSVTATFTAVTAGYVFATAYTGAGFQAQTFNATPVSIDVAFSFVAVGVQQ